MQREKKICLTSVLGDAGKLTDKFPSAALVLIFTRCVNVLVESHKWSLVCSNYKEMDGATTADVF